MMQEAIQRMPYCPLFSINYDSDAHCIGDGCAWWSRSGCCCALAALADAAMEGGNQNGEM